MTQRLLIIDPASSRPYRDTSLAHRPLDGIAASVLRVARTLTGRYQVVVAQAARSCWELGEDGVYYAPFSIDQAPLRGRIDRIICVEDETLLPLLRRRFGTAEILLWLHRFPGESRRELARIAVGCRSRVVAPSDYQRWWMRNFYLRHARGCGVRLEMARVYSPIDAPIAPGAATASWNPDKLLGIAETAAELDELLSIFSAVRRHLPELSLHVASTTEGTAPPPRGEGVVALGPLSRRRLRDELASSLCLFYPRDELRKSSGLIYAEAHAAGTPVLTDIEGAAPEIIGWGEQLCSAADPGAVARRLAAWRAGDRPLVRCRPQLGSNAVGRAWLNLLAPRRPATIPADGPRLAI